MTEALFICGFFICGFLFGFFFGVFNGLLICSRVGRWNQVPAYVREVLTHVPSRAKPWKRIPYNRDY